MREIRLYKNKKKKKKPNIPLEWYFLFSFDPRVLESFMKMVRGGRTLRVAIAGALSTYRKAPSAGSTSVNASPRGRMTTKPGTGGVRVRSRCAASRQSCARPRRAAVLPRWTPTVQPTDRLATMEAGSCSVKRRPNRGPCYPGELYRADCRTDGRGNVVVPPPTETHHRPSPLHEHSSARKVARAEASSRGSWNSARLTLRANPLSLQ